MPYARGLHITRTSQSLLTTVASSYALVCLNGEQRTNGVRLVIGVLCSAPAAASHDGTREIALASCPPGVETCATGDSDRRIRLHTPRRQWSDRLRRAGVWRVRRER